MINLTQHNPTAEQGGLSLPINEVKELLTFKELPSQEEIELRCKKLVGYAHTVSHRFLEQLNIPETWVLIGGAPYLMAPLERALRAEGFTPVYSFSKRVSEESIDDDGNVVKINKFKHVGYVQACTTD